MSSSAKRPVASVILAAGKGTRMKSELPKVLHPLMGKPLVAYVIDACKEANAEKNIVVIGHQAELVKKQLGSGPEYVEQMQQLGTGHALMIAAENLKKFKGDLLVLAGDTPFLTGEILKKLIKRHQKTDAAASLLTAYIDPPLAYGRIIRDDKGQIRKIVEARDATPEELAVIEINTSHYCFKAEKVLPLLSQLTTANDQGEYYLTDIIHLLVGKKERIESILAKDPNVVIGINNRKHLGEAHQLLRNALVDEWSEKGVTFTDPDSVMIGPDVKIGQDTTIMPFTSLLGHTKIDRNCVIGPQVKLVDAQIGANCTVEFAVIENRKVDRDQKIGPFAALYNKEF